MLYLIYGEDVPDSLAQRVASRPAHLADADPYLLSGVYAKVTVKPFRKVLPE